MPQRMLTDDEVSEVLTGEMIIRVAFMDERAPYVIPFGYASLRGLLYGITAPGRKTRIAQRNSLVGFQVDTSARSGPWEWRSATGEGYFEMVEGESERRDALAALEPLISAAPDWWQGEIRPLVAAGIVQVWRITPRRVAGVAYERP